MRWIFWGLVLSTPFYRMTYWDYLGRRVAWRRQIFGGTEDEQRAYAESKRADWGFTPRFKSSLPYSIKTHKYAAQTREEEYNDMPRLNVKSGTSDAMAGVMEPKDVRTLVSIAKEHNRESGVFNYNYPQTFYSTFPEIESETYVTLGGGQGRRVHNEN